MAKTIVHLTSVAIALEGDFWRAYGFYGDEQEPRHKSQPRLSRAEATYASLHELPELLHDEVEDEPEEDEDEVEPSPKDLVDLFNGADEDE